MNYKDDRGEVFDFHALRNFYISTVVGGKVSAKVAQKLARHSTPNLTIGRYSRAHLSELVSALDALPPLANPASAAQNVATGEKSRKPRSAWRSTRTAKQENQMLRAAKRPEN